MADQQVLIRHAAGLYSQNNKLHEVPEGALVTADDAVIDKEGVISKRRGFKRYGTQLTNTATSIFEFNKRLVVLDGETMRPDSDGAGTWGSWAGSFSPPNGSKIHSIEANKNFYFTTSKGIYKNDSLTGTPVRSGMPQGLDLRLSLFGTGADWFTPNSQIGYRIVWTRKDASNNLIVGSPSFRETIANPYFAVTFQFAGGVVNVIHTVHGYANGDKVEINSPSDPGFEAGQHVITVIDTNAYFYTVASTPPSTGSGNAGKIFKTQIIFTVPSDILVGDSYEIYRTELAATSSTDPGDEHFLVFTGKVASQDLVVGTISLIDIYGEGFLGERLYTNALREGISAANDRPPWAKFIAEFKGHVFYAHTFKEHFAKIQILDIAGIVDDTDTITIGSDVFKFSTVEDLTLKKFQRFTSEPTTAQNIEKTAKSLIRVINRYIGSIGTIRYAFYISGIEDPPGIILIRNRELDGASFQISSTVGSKFTPNLSTALTSENDEKKNGLYRSKAQIPEAVPAGSNTPVGSVSKEFLGIHATEDYLLLFKEDGMFVLSGESDGRTGSSFIINLIDSTLKVLVQESITDLDNSVLSFTELGIQRSTGQGSFIVSRQIEPDILKATRLQNFSTISHSISYESDKKLFFFTKSANTDLPAKIAWVWNYLTSGGVWTRMRKPVAAGIVLSGNDRLYLAHAEDPFILAERKDYAPSDFVDEDIPCTVTAVSTTVNADGKTVSLITVTYTYATPISFGWILQQGNLSGSIAAVENLGSNSFRLTLTKLRTGYTAAAATVGMAIDMKVEWVPQAAGNAALLKQYSACQIYFDGNFVSKASLGFQGDLNAKIENISDVKIADLRSWGASPWGSSSWGDSSRQENGLFRSIVPFPHQRCRSLSVRFRHRIAKEKVDILQMTLDVRMIGSATQRVPA